MPWKVVPRSAVSESAKRAKPPKEGSKFALIKPDSGKVVGWHPSREKAERHRKAIAANYYAKAKDLWARIKHGGGSHDQSSHGNWASGGTREEDRPLLGSDYDEEFDPHTWRMPRGGGSSSDSDLRLARIEKRMKSVFSEIKPEFAHNYHTSKTHVAGQGSKAYVQTRLIPTASQEKKRLSNKLGGTVGKQHRKAQFNAVRRSISKGALKAGVFLKKVPTARDSRTVVNSLNHTQVYDVSSPALGRMGTLVIDVNTRGIDVEFTS